MSRFIEITLIVELPQNATDQDIKEWVDVEYFECNSMKPDNPCVDAYEVHSASWRNDD